MRARAVILALVALVGAGSAVRADQPCRVLVYQFQPLPFDAAHEFPIGVATGSGALEEGGPQIAIWLETAPPSGAPPAQRGSFAADIFISARTGNFGIGNRAGDSMMASSPRFPYGARDGVLPVWAWARGQSYPLLVMQDANQGSFRFHNAGSTIDNFFCRPLLPTEIVDAVTCPTSIFSSDKGTFDPTGRRVLYPPRHDVAAGQCHLATRGCVAGCDAPACTMLADLDDVAAVSGATPNPYLHAPYTGLWRVPAALADGDYYVFIEVNKQYDQDAGRCPSGSDSECSPAAPLCDPNSHLCAQRLALLDNMGQGAYGLRSNFGQPSVVWATRVTVDAAGTHVGLADDALGYGPWDHPADRPAGGDASWAFGIHPLDGTISKRDGSGAGRLARVVDADGAWRFKVTAKTCLQCAAAVPPIDDLHAVAPDGDRIDIDFTNVSAAGAPVAAYEVRYLVGNKMDLNAFLTASPAPPVAPGPPGTRATVTLGPHEGIQALRTYTIGARAVGDCGTTSDLRTFTLTTPRQSFQTVDGCFVATAAYGSALAPQVALLRGWRDRALAPHPVGRALVRMYYAASPALARAIAGSPGARVAVRALLAPVIALARATLGAVD